MRKFLQVIGGKYNAVNFMVRYGYWYLIPLATLKTFFYKYKISRLGIPKWHAIPAEARPYSMDIARFVNKYSSDDSTVVEVGCGLGDILGKIKLGHKYGLDTDSVVVETAKKMHGNADTTFLVGSFDDLGNLPVSKIDFFICVQVLHAISPENLKDIFAKLFNSIKIETVCIDMVPVSDGWLHNIADYVPDEYVLISKKTYKHKSFQGPTNLIFSKNKSIIADSHD